MLRQHKAGGLSFCLLALLVSEYAWALDPSGEAVKVIPAAAASGQVGSRILEIKGPVFMGDRVTTDQIGEAQILFRDDTRLVVGPNSRIIIDRFVYNPDRTARQVSMSAVKGTFRFITGVSRKQAYSIRTPTMSIGVRGTQFDFAVRPGGETVLALYQGGARLCDARQRCVDVEGGCTVVVAEPGGGLRGIDGAQLSQTLDTYFPYARAQRRLLRGFRVDVSECGGSRNLFPRSGERKRERRAALSPGIIDPDGSDGGADSGGGGGGGGVGGGGGSPDGS
jgi:hypothetical protein